MFEAIVGLGLFALGFLAAKATNAPKEEAAELNTYVDEAGIVSEESQELTGNLDLEQIQYSLQETTGDLWYIEENDDTWSILSSAENTKKPFVIMTVKKEELAEDTIVNEWPRKEDADFIVNSRNEYIPVLLEVVEAMIGERQYYADMIQKALDNTKNTREDFKKTLLDLQTVMLESGFLPEEE